jgi:hypothetical protein
MEILTVITTTLAVFFGIELLLTLRKLHKVEGESFYWRTQYEDLKNSLPKRNKKGRFTKKVK